jgi:hypothetical protein
VKLVLQNVLDFSEDCKALSSLLIVFKRAILNKTVAIAFDSVVGCISPAAIWNSDKGLAEESVRLVGLAHGYTLVFWFNGDGIICVTIVLHEI